MVQEYLEVQVGLLFPSIQDYHVDLVLQLLHLYQDHHELLVLPLFLEYQGNQEHHPGRVVLKVQEPFHLQP